MRVLMLFPLTSIPSFLWLFRFAGSGAGKCVILAIRLFFFPNRHMEGWVRLRIDQQMCDKNKVFFK